VRSYHHIERNAVRRSIALGKAGRTMKKPTKVKMGIAKTLDKLQALHRMVVAIQRGPPIRSSGHRKLCASCSLLLPSEPGFASLSTATGREYQIDMERLSSVEPGNFGGASDFSP